MSDDTMKMAAAHNNHPKWAETEAKYEVQYSSFVATYGDGPRSGVTWVFDRASMQPDITARELAEILTISMRLDDELMARLKADPAVLRHFRREEPA